MRDSMNPTRFITGSYVNSLSWNRCFGSILSRPLRGCERIHSEERIPKNEFRRTNSGLRTPYSVLRFPNGLEPSSPKDPPHRESGISQVPSHSFTVAQGLGKHPVRRAKSEERSPKSEV